MSEYQYYEFVAIDQPLTSAQMAELRARSSRATITPASFVNQYHWGDLKGDPIDWMRRYFDAFVYVANWCWRSIGKWIRVASSSAAPGGRRCRVSAEDCGRTIHSRPRAVTRLPG